ncbi:MAG TPA: hypothetical protein VM221_01085 [Armatimonadota bacterium]|nr:hypothetical protein [Armatimonadota bacterium]
MLVVALLAGLGPAGATENDAVYTRIQVSPGNVVYVQLWQREMRLATSVAALQVASPVQPVRSLPSAVIFPSVALPVASRALPRGWCGARAAITFLRGSLRPSAQAGAHWLAQANIGPCLRDAQGAEWAYLYNYDLIETAPRPEAAPTWGIPGPSAFKLTVVPKVAGRSVYIGLRVTSGDATVTEIERDGKKAEVAKVVLRDPHGATTLAKRFKLSDLGFG